MSAYTLFIIVQYANDNNEYDLMFNWISHSPIITLLLIKINVVIGIKVD